MGRSNKLEVLRIKKTIFDKFLEGKNRREIINETMEKYGIGEDAVIKHYYPTKKEVENIRNEYIGKLLFLHVNRYEEMYKKCMSWGMEMMAMSALAKKEALLGFVEDESLNIVIENNVIKMEKGNQSIDKYLTDEEKERLKYLLEKSGVLDEH